MGAVDRRRRDALGRPAACTNVKFHQSLLRSHGGGIAVALVFEHTSSPSVKEYRYFLISGLGYATSPQGRHDPWHTGISYSQPSAVLQSQRADIFMTPLFWCYCKDNTTLHCDFSQTKEIRNKESLARPIIGPIYITENPI